MPTVGYRSDCTCYCVCELVCPQVAAADRRYVSGLNRRLLEQREADSNEVSPPDVIGIMLRPARMGAAYPLFQSACRDFPTISRDDNTLGSRRADINTHEVTLVDIDANTTLIHSIAGLVLKMILLHGDGTM